VVDDEIDGDARPVRPLRIGRVGSVAHEVACRLPAHDGLLTRRAPLCWGVSAIFSSGLFIEIRFTPARRQASAWPGASPQSTISSKSMSGNSLAARSCRAPR